MARWSRFVLAGSACAAVAISGSLLGAGAAVAVPGVPDTPQTGQILEAPPIAGVNEPVVTPSQSPGLPVTPESGLAGADAASGLEVPASLPVSIDEARAQIAVLQQQSAAAGERANGVREQLDATQSRISQLARKATDARIELLRQQRTLERLAKQIYVNGGVTEAALSFTLDDPDRFLADLDRLIAASDTQSQVLSKARAEVLALKTSEEALANEQDRLVRTTQALAGQQALVDTKLLEAQQILDSLQEAERQRLLEEARVAAETARLEAAAARAQLATLDTVTDPALTSAGSGSGVTASDASVQRVIDFALSKVGGPYVWGASGPDAYDCSGLTQAAWAQAGVSLTHYSGTQYTGTTPVSLSDIRPGDLLYFYNTHQHVGLYIGNGKFVHAANSNDGIRLDSLSGHYQENLVAASRPSL
jgi:peptidoglycan DL-endopeptidase CwlO